MEKTLNQIDKNYEIFLKELPELLKVENNLNKFSLWHDGKIEGIFDTESDAIQVGKDKYKEFENFSIQQITKDVFDLGSISLCQ